MEKIIRIWISLWFLKECWNNHLRNYLRATKGRSMRKSEGNISCRCPFNRVYSHFTSKSLFLHLRHFGMTASWYLSLCRPHPPHHCLSHLVFELSFPPSLFFAPLPSHHFSVPSLKFCLSLSLVSGFSVYLSLGVSDNSVSTIPVPPPQFCVNIHFSTRFCLLRCCVR